MTIRGDSNEDRLNNQPDANDLHVTGDLLIRFTDDEISPAEAERVRAHFAVCQSCKSKFQRVAALSTEVESLIFDAWPRPGTGRRELFAQALNRAPSGGDGRISPGIIRRFGWSMGLAAALAAGVLVLPMKWRTGVSQVPAARASAANFIEVDGESFVQLPYSNPELATGGPHVVQIEVPASSLAEAGVVFEPVSSQSVASDRSVLADVLLGADGQPLGVHIVTAE